MADVTISPAPQGLLETTLMQLNAIFEEFWLKLSCRQAEMEGRNDSGGPSHHLQTKAKNPTLSHAQQIKSANMSRKSTRKKPRALDARIRSWSSRV
ncbi:Hypothetical predicted protein [Pelobates cultripes]|uniref:Uncharacterized protein n=1 Tax=Pelobates cultripes TaxID=61616 RepID=A0AAD1WBA5_PELCU|nr:Hypothetical predicted protein [Pelobates cultripes]